MKCDIEKCNEKAHWIVDDRGVDAYLCPKHYEEFKSIEKKMKEKKLRVGLFH
jgi:3-deoxy-D-manno-octulosonic-acid transferase